MFQRRAEAVGLRCRHDLHRPPVVVCDARVAPCAKATLSRTVVGKCVDSSGAYDWSVPTVSVTTLAFTCQWLSGIPTFQRWIVVPAAATSVSGHLDVSTSAPSPTLAIEHDDGSPVLELLAGPFVVPVAPAGGYAFTTRGGWLPPPAGSARGISSSRPQHEHEHQQQALAPAPAPARAPAPSPAQSPSRHPATRSRCPPWCWRRFCPRRERRPTRCS